MTTAIQNDAEREAREDQGWLIEVFFTYLQTEDFLNKDQDCQRAILGTMLRALI